MLKSEEIVQAKKIGSIAAAEVYQTGSKPLNFPIVRTAGREVPRLRGLFLY
jgi:hypothetical protein